MSKNGNYLTEVQVERRKAVIDTLKSFIFPLILAAIIFVAVLIIINFVNVEEEDIIVQPYSYDLAEDAEPIVIENDQLCVTMDPATTGFTVLQKSTGKVWDSYAFDGENDMIAQGSEKGRLQSNLLLTYSIETGLDTTYDTYTFSVANKIYEIQSDATSIKVFYSLGNIEKEYVIPTVIREADMDVLVAQMSGANKNVISQYYKKLDINNLSSADKKKKDEYLEKYPIFETEVIYMLREGTKENLKAALQGYFEEAGYTYEQYLADKELDQSEKSSDKPIFNVELDLRIEGNDLVVEVPYSSLECKNKYFIYKITPLPCFGASGMEDDGYMLVPEGGGAKINFNNGKTTIPNYAANVYGWDMDITRADVVHNTRAYYAMFGQATAGSSYLCMLEDGASYATIYADVSAKNSSYNRVYAEYIVANREKYDVGDIANTAVYVYDENYKHEKIVQRYRFCDTTDYNKLAVKYRDYLKETYGAEQFTLNTGSDAPVNIEMVGAVDKVKQIVGIPVSRPLPLTTFDEADNIIKELFNNGVMKMSVKYTGWCNGGVSQKILKNVNLVNGLGGAGKLKKFTSDASSLGVDVYLNGITQYEHKSTIFNGFNSFVDAARLISKDRAELHQYSHVTYAMRESSEPYYLLHTEVANKMTENLIKAANKYNAGVAFEDLGMDLSADYYKKNPYTREEVKAMHTQILKDTDATGQKIMVNMGNDYAVAYVDMITDMDLKGSGYTIIDEEIPFYQIALHGYVNYTGESLNVCGDYQNLLLESAEYGAGLSFTLMGESSFTLQKTLYTQYFGADYDGWKDKLIEIYNRYNSELGHTFSQEIVRHESFNGNVKCTTYADGTRVYVNYDYNDKFITPEGKFLMPRDYLVIK